jgi:hypothetical protein
MAKQFPSRPLRWLTIVFSLLYLWFGLTGPNKWVMCFESDGYVALEQAAFGIIPACSDKGDVQQPSKAGISAASNQCVDVPVEFTAISQANGHHLASLFDIDAQDTLALLAYNPMEVGYLDTATVNLLSKPPPSIEKRQLAFLQTIRLII